jgi:hypothetical protein
MEDRQARAPERAAEAFEVAAADLAPCGDAAQIDQSRQTHTALQRHAVDSGCVVEEVKWRIHVRPGMHAQLDAAQVHGGLVDNLDADGTVAGKDRRIRANRLAEIDDPLRAHPISPILNEAKRG